MKKKFLFAILCSALLSGCTNTENAVSPETTVQQTEETTQELNIASGSDTIEADEVGFEGMAPVYADSLKDGIYSINVDSSSSMFKIVECELTVTGGEMSAKMTMSGTGYDCIYMGTAEEAATGAENDRIIYTEENGVHSYTVPVEALNKEINCAALSTKKQLWYDRKLVFRADSLPFDAFTDDVVKTVESLGLADGEYTAEVTLSGGSGKANVQSPAKITVSGGKASAEIIWSSNKYDYMIVDGEKYLPTSTKEFSVFEIPVSAFDYNMPVSADTTAMSKPYEIEYTLNFDSSTIS